MLCVSRYFEGKIDVDRHRLFALFQLAKIDAAFFHVADFFARQIGAHLLAQQPARLRVRRREDAFHLIRAPLIGEARGKAGDFIAAFLHHFCRGYAEPAQPVFRPYAAFLCSNGVPICPLPSAWRGHSPKLARAPLRFFSHMMRPVISPCADCPNADRAPNFNQGFGDNCRSS